MPVPIKLYGGKLNDFEDSMAEEIEKALNQVRSEEGMPALPTGDKDRRMLFIAIARGVINHLQKKQEGFTVTVTDGHSHSGHTSINVKRPPNIPL
ncbi:MAG: hypothetical protein K8F52_05615 [Candidatus Scalindua rubra]|uniref:Uncharacterized protein n=1 Tax=Candidatus Scalindua brodae TaxID=237368 RepID=A0A0B0EN59_9BACT|nr:MAG: hypothetical protein SCABRO_00842 [Candidatus Scalindua brodae]MBZ0108125.1 hypothetical protein [Candidatus Scalindua rubra]TWU31256.1 hypothetical protein S225a_22020 [Candidatus Brocadiaceae bacterium S225]